MNAAARQTMNTIREVCALGRVEFARPASPEGDPDAGRTLVAGLQALDQDGEPSDISLSLDLLAPRAPYFDRLVRHAIADGVRQVVNLGAGYDDRSLRFRSAGVRFFEVDLPDVIADKTRRLEAIDTVDVALSGADFATDDLDVVLASAGHDAEQPTLFIAEHLLLFLEPAEVAQLVAGVSNRSARGSTLALTAETHPADLESATVVTSVDDEMFGGASPVRTIKSADAWLKLVDWFGWQVTGRAGITAVPHFEVPVNGVATPIVTQFLTAVS